MAILNKIQLSGVTYDLVDASAVHSLEGYATEAYVTAATNALAESIAEQGYQTSADVQTRIDQSVSGKLDTSIFATYSGATDTALASKFAGASWNSTDKKIYFYDNA